VSFSVVFSGLEEALAALALIPQRAKAATHGGVEMAAHAMEAEAKGNAPVVTGTLRRSIYTEGPMSDGADVLARVGPTVVYGRRVELGFSGADSLGRVYNQEGRPYMRPAYEAILPQLAEIMRAAWASALA
jgi:hypothetical protein